MTSRLDRLFLHLENGSNATLRLTAAKALGEVARCYPRDLDCILNRLSGLLRLKSWSTRIAAGEAVRSIAENLPLWDPAPVPGGSSDDEDEPGFLSLSELSLDRVLECGARLYSTDVSEMDESCVPPTVERSELNRRMGLPVFIRTSSPGVADECCGLTEEDVTFHRPVTTGVSQYSSDVQASVRTAFKRRTELDRTARPPASKMRRTESVELQACDQGTTSASTTEVGSECDENEERVWCLEWFCVRLLCDLWDTKWEIRHGAATGLRELLRRHAGGVGCRVGQTQTQMRHSRQRHLEDIVVRVLCTLALDQLSDFISDEVVAPVRETCAQILGVLARHLDQEPVTGQVDSLVDNLLQLTRRNENWMIAHGGLLGIKYLLAARQDLADQLVPLVYPVVTGHLFHSTDDDIRSAAASALLPIVPRLDSVGTTIENLSGQLWRLLASLGPLSTATNALITLVAALPESLDVKDRVSGLLEERVQLLLRFSHYESTSVRDAAVRTLASLLRRAIQEGVRLTPTLVHLVLEQVFQCVLIDSDPNVVKFAETVWHDVISHCSPDDLVCASLGRVDVWLCHTMQPSRVPFPATFTAPTDPEAGASGAEQPTQAIMPPAIVEGTTTEHYIGGNTSLNECEEVREEVVLERRHTAIRLLACLFSRMGSSELTLPPDSQLAAAVLLDNLLANSHIVCRSAMQRWVAGLLLSVWPHPEQTSAELGKNLHARLETCLMQQIYYEEILPSYRQAHKECRQLINQMTTLQIPVDPVYTSSGVLNLTQCQALVTSCSIQVLDNKRTGSIGLLEARAAAKMSVDQCASLQAKLAARVDMAISAALIAWTWIGDRVTPLIRPLMDAVRSEPSAALQHLAATALARLMAQCAQRETNPGPKVVKNLATYLVASDASALVAGDDHAGVIVALHLSSSSGSNTSNSGARGRTAAICCGVAGSGTVASPMSDSCTNSPVPSLSAGAATSSPNSPSPVCPPTPIVAIPTDEGDQQLRAIRHRGSQLALEAICDRWDASKLPALWDMIYTAPLAVTEKRNLSEGDMEVLIMGLSVAEVCLPTILQEQDQQCMSASHYVATLVLPPLLTRAEPRLRHLAARLLATLTATSGASQLVEVMELVLDRVLPALDPMLLTSSSSSTVNAQMGAMEAIYYIVERCEMSVLLPYLVLLVMPVLGRTSDPCPSLRDLASQLFATLLTLIPMESSVTDPPGFPEHRVRERAEKRCFIDCLLHPSRIPDYSLPVRINAQLRPYQKEGVNWLSFLNRYELHGILSDDLGLGKTLQTICILAGDHWELKSRRQEQQQNGLGTLPNITRQVGMVKSDGSKEEQENGATNDQQQQQEPPSLVVSPSTVTGHWMYEVARFSKPADLNPLLYAGSPIWRTELQSRLCRHNLIIASYETVRNDIEFFESIHWNYVVLDEGHVIRNAKAKLTRCMKRLRARHRLLLTGTPIQNHVSELWSLFDFLMPGFLGTEAHFNHKFARPISQSKDLKASTRDQELGNLALDSLHRRVLPFMLRRLKEDVLQDLPPKIIQDYVCQLTPLQVKLYEAFSRSAACEEASETVEHEMTPASAPDIGKNRMHVFQALQYLRAVCNHPCLALHPQHPLYTEVATGLAGQNKTLHDVELSGKLVALKQLLLDCGIGGGSTSSATTSISASQSGETSSGLLSQHRVLIFCQVKAMLDLVEKLIRNQLPGVTYLRLDGSVPAANRHSLVLRFNQDPSIDVLLLTTPVGGLGLNLTGADTVIFVEHDWNPMRDLQAMDRAHRIGQKRVVNVYRIIAAGSIEEKILNLQNFKLQIANTVLSEENRSLDSMATGRLFDLFDPQQQEQQQERRPVSGGKGLSTVLSGMVGDLWDEDVYSGEYDLASFVARLGPPDS